MITLEVKSSGRTVTGWRYLWLKKLRGFNPGKHCAGCLAGDYERLVGTHMLANTPVSLGEQGDYDSFYLCGVSLRRPYHGNLHVPMEAEEGGRIEVEASTRDVFVITGARALPIPPLPDGFDGRIKAFTGCRNFQYAVERFGLPPTRRACDAPGPRTGRPAK